MVPNWLYTHVAALVLGAAVSWWFTDLAADAAASKLQATAEHERVEAFRWVAAEQNRSGQAMANADRKATEEVSNAETETARLKRCIADGRGCGLRVQVVRAAPAKCDGVPEAGTAPGLGNRGGEWAELDADARRDYLALRARLPVVEQALKLCVDRYPK